MAAGVTAARRGLGELVARVREHSEAVLLTKNGQPAAVLLPITLYEQFLKRREAVYQVIADVRQQNDSLAMDEDELLTMISEVVPTVRSSVDVVLTRLCRTPISNLARSKSPAYFREYEKRSFLRRDGPRNPRTVPLVYTSS